MTGDPVNEARIKRAEESAPPETAQWSVPLEGKVQFWRSALI
jgi:hypothetical protein